MQLKDLNVKLQTTVQPVFMSRKIAQEFPTGGPKPQLIDQQCVVYQFKCDQCDASYVGYTCRHLFVCVDGHRSKTSSVRIHYDNRHAGTVLDDLCNCFTLLKKCQNKFDCLVNEMLLIKQLRPCLNVQFALRSLSNLCKLMTELLVTLDNDDQDVTETSDSFIFSFCLTVYLYLNHCCQFFLYFQSYIHGSSQAQFVAETHIVIVLSILSRQTKMLCVWP